ncbi:MAG: o-succinylbenzoate synthase, partial [Planctomycetaceae bacterium]
EWAGSAFALARDWLAPAIVNQEIASGRHLQDRLALFKGNPFAKAVLDTAWWSLFSRLQNQPLHRVLGGRRDCIPVGADFGVMDHVDDLLTAMRGAVDDGFPRIKLKFRRGWDLDMLRQVREHFPSQTIHIDCNSGYRLEDIDMFRQVDEFELAMIEQPLAHDDLLDHAKLQASIRTPICLDESVTHPRRAEQAIESQSCQYVNIKPGRVGGLTNAVQIHDLCLAAGIPCWVGGMLESATGAALCIALGTLENFTYPADIFPSSRFYHQDLAEPAVELERSPNQAPMARAVAELPEPRPDQLARRTVQQAVVE